MDDPKIIDPARRSGQASREAPAVIARAAMVLSGAILAGWLLNRQAQPAALAGPPYAVVQTYLNPNPAPNEEFGNAIAWLPSGDQLIVGARSDQLTGPGAPGAVYLIDRNSGGILQTLQKPIPAASDYFGFSLAVSGTSILVGAQLDDTGNSNAGAAYQFDSVTGGLVMSYTNPIVGTQDRFGTSVAFLTDTVLVGAPQFDAPGPISNVGQAYLCLIADGSCPTTIENPTTNSGANFGLAVATLGDRFAVSSPLDGDHGIVYVFTSTSGMLAQTIVPSSTSLGDGFGRALANMDGNLLIGAPNDDTGADDAGAAYLYSPSGDLLQTFLNPEPDNNDTFGAAVAGAGGRVLIGAPRDSTDGLDSGRAYLFDAATGALLDTFQRSPAQPGALFGVAVAVQGESFLVGAAGDDTGADIAGAVYRFGDIPPDFSDSTKSVSSTIVQTGDLFTYTLTITNKGTVAASFALTDTLDPRLSLVTAPGLSGTSTLTATGIISGGAQLTFQIGVTTNQPFNAAVTNEAQLTGDGSNRSLIAPLVRVANWAWLPLLFR